MTIVRCSILSRTRQLQGVASLLLLAGGGCAAVPGPAPESTPLRLLSSNGVRAAIEAVQPQMEMALDLRLSAEFSTATALKRRIDAGEPFDVAILTPALIDDLVKQGKAVADSRADLARVGVGVGAREGAPRSDVSTPEALKRTLLDAKVVAYTAEGQISLLRGHASDMICYRNHGANVLREGGARVETMESI